MQPETIAAAIEEAERFIRRAKAYQRAEDRSLPGYNPGTNPRESGALRRASMDLTRALADLRQGR